MIFINDEKLQGVVNGLYYDVNNNLHSGVYETCDDAWLLVNVNTYERLVSKSPITTGMTIDEAEEMYGDEIIQRYLVRQEQSKKSNSLINLEKGHKVYKRSSEVRKAKVLALIIQGYAKGQIESELNICRSTIDKILHDLREDMLLDLFNKYRNTLFSDVSGGSLNDFISVGCSYSKYNKLLKSR